METNKHAAIESNLGYYYQALYGLIILLKSNDESYVSLETYDDIYLEEGERQSLFQLKHKSKEIKHLSIKSDDLWKTLLIWSKVKDKKNCKFILVTCDYIEDNNILYELTTKENRKIDNLKFKLLDEASRVINARGEYEIKVASKEIKRQKQPPYENRVSGCEAFSKMNPSEIDILLKNILIIHSEFKIFDIEEEIGQLITIVSKQIRIKVVKRLIEWWSYRALKSMMDNKFREITKNELQIKLTELISELREERFQINNLNIKPSPTEAQEHKKNSINLIKQIELVDGGDIRKNKALVNSWKAKKHRDEWIEDDLSNAYELEQYDLNLIEAWEYRFGLMKSKSLSDFEKKELGLELYDWSYAESKNEIDVMHETLLTNYLVHGTYQSLSNQLRLGWHSDYEEILGVDKKDE